MRSILERAIEHLLNEDHEKAESLFHKFIVERARQVHESLRQGDEITLTEGWDDEIVSEEYYSDEDLGGEDSMEQGDATDTLASDEDVNVDDDMGGEGDMGGEEGEMGDEGSTADKLNDFESELEELTSKFKDMLATLDVDGLQDESEGDDMSSPEDDMGASDTTDVDAPADDSEGDASGEEMQGEENPEMDEEDMWESYNLDDITESVIAELEKITVDAKVDGKMTDGKKIAQNTSSTLPNTPVGQRMQGAKPAKSPFTKNDSMARETPPTSKQFPHGKLNSYKRTTDLQNKVEPKGAANAALNKDFAGGVKPSQSPIAGKSGK